MLNIRKTQSGNYVSGEGLLTELEVIEGISKSGKDYVRVNASIKVDQEIDGKVVENIVNWGAFTMKFKTDNSPNPNYTRLVDYKNKLIPLASAETANEASRVKFTGNLAENVYVNRATGLLNDKHFNVEGRYLNIVAPTRAEKDSALFELKNVIVGKEPKRETNKDGEETGRVVTEVILIGWNGKAEVIPIVATTPEAVNFVEQNWSKGDTVNISGIINCSMDKESWLEPQDFGDPIERTRTISRKELVMNRASKPLDESKSYDSNEIKEVLLERNARNEALIADSKKSKPAPPVKKTTGSEDLDW